MPSWTGAKPPSKPPGRAWRRPRRRLRRRATRPPIPGWWRRPTAWSPAWRPRSARVVSAGTPVLRIAQDGARDVVFAVPEDKVVHLKAGQAVTVRSWAGGATLQGQVREVAASADPVTRTFAVRADIDAAQAPPWEPRCMSCPRRSAWRACRHQTADHGAAPGRHVHGGVGVRRPIPAPCVHRRCRWPQRTATKP